MNKEALGTLSQYTPWEMLGSGAAVGAGTYGTIRLLQELLQTKKKPVPSNQLVVPYPEPSAASQKLAEDGNLLFNLPALAAGGVGGFIGGDMLYRNYQKKKLQQQIEQAHQERQKLLSLMPKQASETPRVNAFCEKIAEELEKKASVGDWLGGIGHAAGQSISGAASGIGKVLNLTDGQHWDALSRRVSLGDSAADHSTLSLAGADNVPKAWSALALLTALGVGGALGTARMNRSRSEEGKRYPSRVVLKPEASLPSSDDADAI